MAIDYNQKWGWVQNPQKTTNNVLAPLGGGGGGESAPSPVMAGPSMEDKLTGAVTTAVGTKMADNAIKGATAPLAAKETAAMVGQGASAAKDSQAAMLAAQNLGMGAEMAGDAAKLTGEALGAGTQATAAAAEATGAAAGLGEMAGPLGAAIGGVMKGEYDEAAGAAAGAILGSTFGPIGTFVGAKLGGMAGNAVGSMFGFAEGTEEVKKPEPKPKSIWDRIIQSGRDAVAASAKSATGNDGTLGQAKSALSGRARQLEEAEMRAVKGYADGTPFVAAQPAGGKAVAQPQQAAGPQVTGKYFQELNEAYDPIQAGQAKTQQNAFQGSPAMGGKGGVVAQPTMGSVSTSPAGGGGSNPMAEFKEQP